MHSRRLLPVRHCARPLTGAVMVGTGCAVQDAQELQAALLRQVPKGESGAKLQARFQQFAPVLRIMEVGDCG